MYRYDISEMETGNQQLLQRPTMGLRIQNNRKINKQDKKIILDKGNDPLKRRVSVVFEAWVTMKRIHVIRLQL